MKLLSKGFMDVNADQKISTKDKYHHSLVLFGLFWGFCITVSRAIRWPNDWAEAQWLISYEFGFIKRGLAGTLIAPFANSGDINSSAEFVIRGASISFFMIFCVVMLWICYRIVEKNQYSLNSVLLALIFLTSPYVVMSAHLIGYFDNIIIIITVFSSFILMRDKVWLASVILSVGILIHETAFLVGFPSFLFVALIKCAKEGGASSNSQLLIGFVSRYKVLFILPLLTLLSIVINQTLFIDSAELKVQLINHVSNYGFVRENRNIIVPTSFTTSFFHYLSTESQSFVHIITYKIYLINDGLPLLVLLVYGWHVLRDRLFQGVIFTALVIITLLPLSLHLIAWDSSRIWLYPLVVLMIGLWTINEIFDDGKNSEKEQILFGVFGTMLVIFQIFIVTPLMDGERERLRDITRILYYFPSLILFAMSASKNYRLTRVCVYGQEKS